QAVLVLADSPDYIVVQLRLRQFAATSGVFVRPDLIPRSAQAVLAAAHYSSLMQVMNISSRKRPTASSFISWLLHSGSSYARKTSRWVSLRSDAAISSDALTFAWRSRMMPSASWDAAVHFSMSAMASGAASAAISKSARFISFLLSCESTNNPD